VNFLVQYRFVFVIALLAVAAWLVTDRARLPPVLGGIGRVLRGKSPSAKLPLPAWRRLLAFLLVVAAFLVAAA